MNDRRKLANGKEIWVIKAAFPDEPRKIHWSDYIFANTMKKYLERLGYYVIVESADEWYNQEAADVVVVLRGDKAYSPDRNKPGCIYIMWNLSHPSTITCEEYDAYDYVCIGSLKEEYINDIKSKIHVPVRSIPMCVDTEIFYPDEHPYEDKKYDWVFVGNSRYKERKSITWAVKQKIPLKIWGADWDRFIEEKDNFVVAEFISNQEVPMLYRNAKATIDDHFDDMIQNGFINTRIVEAIACGLPVLSDYSEVLTRMFGDAILCYRNEQEFTEQIDKMEKEYSVIKEKTMALWPLIQEKYSFQSCINQLDRLRDECKLHYENCIQDVRAMSYEKEPYKESAVGLWYQEFHEFLEAGQNLEYKDSDIDLKVRLEQLRENFQKLTWKEQDAFHELNDVEKMLFEVWVKNEVDHHRLLIEKQKIEEENHIFKEKNAELIIKLQKAYEQKNEINEKLQRTYAEKSEINRKLQITYGEKYDRGIEIKRLKKEIESIKKSRTYKLARWMGAPVRIFRKLVKRFRNT